MAAFRTEHSIRFRHCDQAGIVFYPRYVELLNDVVEDWFAAMGLPFGDLLARGLAAPMAALDVQFHRPSRLGEVLAVTLVVERIGRTSCRVTVHLAGPDAVPRVTFVATMVCAGLAELRPLPWPDDLRREMSRYLTVGVQSA